MSFFVFLLQLNNFINVLSVYTYERGGIVSEFNLDDRSLGTSSAIGENLKKLVRVGTGLEIKHVNMYEYLNASVVKRNGNTLRIRTKELIRETLFFPGDCVVLNYSDGNNLFVISGKIKKINSLNPLDLSISVTRLEKLKDSRKYQRYYVSLTANLDVPGFSDKLFVVVKNISSGGVKINCSDYLPFTNIVGVEVILDRINNLFFKGEIVRNGRSKGYFEYGIEIQEISEANYKCLKHYLNWLSNDYKNI